MGSNLTFPICWVATAETRTGRRAAARARISLDPRRPEAEEPATAVCCVREEGANIFFSRSSAARELPRSGRVARVPSGARTLVRSCGVARWCSARGFVEQRMRCEWLEANRRGVLEGRTFFPEPAGLILSLIGLLVTTNGIYVWMSTAGPLSSEEE